jgi:hypothetical protein
MVRSEGDDLTMLALGSLGELALKADDLRLRRALVRQEYFVGLGVHTLNLAFMIVIVRNLAASSMFAS